MLAYHYIELSREKRESEVTAESNDEKLEMSAYLVEKIIKKYKSHRGATDFDSAYIDAVVSDMKSGLSDTVAYLRQGCEAIAMKKEKQSLL
jgi:hypothetical protein